MYSRNKYEDFSDKKKRNKYKDKIFAFYSPPSKSFIVFNPNE